MIRPLTILLIEDSEEDSVLVLHKLRRAGFEPIFARVDTEPALKTVLDERKWDIVLCDYNMPFLDCRRALKLVKHKDPEVPFILVSGFATNEMAEEIVQAGANSYISKSYLEKLIPLIEAEMIITTMKNKSTMIRPGQTADSTGFVLDRP